jgi:sulfonate transport system substrate-binding protein
MRLRTALLAIGVTSVMTAAAILSTTLLFGGADPGAGSGETRGGTLTIDFATYNPLSLIIRDQGWLEEALAERDVAVEWVQSAGSNKANELLRAGAADVASTAGSAALLARSNGSPIQTIAIYSQPEWAALVVPGDADIGSVADLRGKRIAATKGTDPYFFLLQTLEEAGVGLDEVTVENLQHADGWAALQNGAVDAWAGLDPIMAAAEESGAVLLYRNLDFNSYGFLNATESFLAEKPDLAQLVVDAYARAREWAAEHPEETAQILADVAGLDLAVATKVIEERSNLDADPAPGEAHRAVLATIGPIFVDSGDVASQAQIDQALDTLFNDTHVAQADAGRIGR